MSNHEDIEYMSFHHEDMEYMSIHQGTNLLLKAMIKLLKREYDFVNLRGADLQSANLRDANLKYAHFEGADLTGANFKGADLTGADLTNAKLRDPNEGSYMLNAVLKLLKDEYNFFENVSTRESRVDFINKILSIGRSANCNDEEILKGLAKYLNYCYLCKSSTADINEGDDICNNCYAVFD